MLNFTQHISHSLNQHTPKYYIHKGSAIGAAAHFETALERYKPPNLGALESPSDPVASPRRFRMRVPLLVPCLREARAQGDFEGSPRRILETSLWRREPSSLLLPCSPFV